MKRSICLWVVALLASGAIGFGPECRADDQVVPAIPLQPATSTESPVAKVTEAFFKVISRAAGVATPQPAPAVVIDGAFQEPVPSSEGATHEQLKVVKVAGDRGAALQTLALSGDGHVVCLLGPSRYAAVGVEGAESTPPSEVRIYDADGNELRRWSVPFAGQSVAVSPKNEVYVAGDGFVARYTADGKLEVKVEVPHILAMVKDSEALAKQAEEQIKSTKASYQEQIKQLKSQLQQFTKKPEAGEDANIAADRKVQAQFIEQQLKAYENAMQSVANQKVEDVVRQLTSRARIINGLSVTDKDVYLMCGETKGYGYSLWRMDLAMSESEKVLSRLSGCCGQMDVQVRGDTIAIAENTRHRVARYDRTGTLVDSFGTRGRESKGNAFGGCCNPMNCRITGSGDIYTSESEGIVKRFNAQGEFVALIGVVKLTGGCKNVAVAATDKGDRVYFCDLPGSQFVILKAKESAAAAAAAGAADAADGG